MSFKQDEISICDKKFGSLADASKEELLLVGAAYRKDVDDKIVDNMLAMLKAQKGMLLAQAVDLYEHGLQCATRAHRGGEDIDIVVMSLLHDMTETIVSKNHGDAAAGFLEPYLSPKATWMLRTHEVFQGFYYFHHVGGNRDERERYKDEEYYQDLIDWCEKYDQASFDANYESLPLEFFVPMVTEVLTRPEYWWDEKHPKASLRYKNGRD